MFLSCYIWPLSNEMWVLVYFEKSYMKYREHRDGIIYRKKQNSGEERENSCMLRSYLCVQSRSLMRGSVIYDQVGWNCPLHEGTLRQNLRYCESGRGNDVDEEYLASSWLYFISTAGCYFLFNTLLPLGLNWSCRWRHSFFALRCLLRWLVVFMTWGSDGLLLTSHVVL